MNDTGLITETDLAGLRRKATSRAYRFTEDDGGEVDLGIDTLAALVRQYAIEDGGDPNFVEALWRTAALVVDGECGGEVIITQPQTPEPGSLAEMCAPLIEELRAAHKFSVDSAPRPS